MNKTSFVQSGVTIENLGHGEERSASKRETYQTNPESTWPVVERVRTGSGHRGLLKCAFVAAMAISKPG